jgi:hypothetical protein
MATIERPPGNLASSEPSCCHSSYQA